MILAIGFLCIAAGLIITGAMLSKRKIYKLIKEGNLHNYKKTIGVVTCCAFDPINSADIYWPVTPIVEYEVNGEKYEVRRNSYNIGYEEEVGTKMTVWYNEKDPFVSVLDVDLHDNSFGPFLLLGILTFIFGLSYLFFNL